MTDEELFDAARAEDTNERPREGENRRSVVCLGGDGQAHAQHPQQGLGPWPISRPYCP